MIAFFVGPEHLTQIFVVHKDFATFYSPVFQRTFNSKLAEGETQKMRLQDVTAGEFGRFVHWLYTKDIEGDTDLISEAPALAKLWDLAASFQVVEFQNKIIIKLFRLVKQVNGDQLVKLLHYAYERIEDTALKRLVVDKIAWHIEPKKLKYIKKKGYFPKQIWAKIALVYNNHYWNKVPGDHFHEWRGEDYLVTDHTVMKEQEEKREQSRETA